MYTESHWRATPGRLSPAQNLENRRDQFAAMRRREPATTSALFLQNVHVSRITPAACLWYIIRAIAYYAHEMQQRISVFCCNPYVNNLQLGARRSRWDLAVRFIVPNNVLDLPSGRQAIFVWTAKRLDQAEGKIAARSSSC